MMRKKELLAYLFPLALGIALFFIFCGKNLLDPKMIDWMAGDGDPGTMYVGARFFIKEPWHFPLGYIQDYGYPFGANIGMTDSIPLMGIVTKLFKSFIQGDFQYFGAWLMISFVMQSLCAFHLGKKQFKNFLPAALFCVLVTASPTLLFRIHVGHYSLTAQWLLLIAFYFYFFSEQYNFKKWFALMFAASLIMPYFWLMTYVIFLTYSLKCYLQKTLPKKTALFNAAKVPVFTFITWETVGTLSKKFALAGGGFAFHGANLNTLFNTNEWTELLPTLSYATNGQYEGYAYLGLGGLLLCFSALGLYFWDKELKAEIKANLEIKIFSCMLLLFFIMSTFPAWYFGKTIVFSVAPIIKFLKISKVFEIFRANGRFVWVSWYGLIFLSFFMILKNKKVSQKMTLAFLVLVVCLQAVDLYPLIQKINDKKKSIVFNRIENTPASSALVKQYSHLFIIPNDFNPELGDFALRNNLTISTSYMARVAIGQINYYLQRLEDFHMGKLDNELLYVVDLENLTKLCTKNAGLVENFYVSPISKYFMVVEKSRAPGSAGASLNCGDIETRFKKGQI